MIAALTHAHARSPDCGALQFATAGRALHKHSGRLPAEGWIPVYWKWPACMPRVHGSCLASNCLSVLQLLFSGSPAHRRMYILPDTLNLDTLLVNLDQPKIRPKRPERPSGAPSHATPRLLHAYHARLPPLPPHCPPASRAAFIPHRHVMELQPCPPACRPTEAAVQATATRLFASHQHLLHSCHVAAGWYWSK